MEVSISEAKEHSSYSHEYLVMLVRRGRVKGRRSGKIWLIDLDDLKAYEARMNALGPSKHSPKGTCSDL